MFSRFFRRHAIPAKHIHCGKIGLSSPFYSNSARNDCQCSLYFFPRRSHSHLGQTRMILFSCWDLGVASVWGRDFRYIGRSPNLGSCTCFVKRWLYQVAHMPCFCFGPSIPLSVSPLSLYPQILFLYCQGFLSFLLWPIFILFFPFPTGSVLLCNFAPIRFLCFAVGYAIQGSIVPIPSLVSVQ